MAVASDTASRADYQRMEVGQMLSHWIVVDDVREGTQQLRFAKGAYLPKFQSEDLNDWEARAKMTFVPPTYSDTLDEHVGMVFTTQPELGDDVPEIIHEHAENIDGIGTHWHVFARECFERAYHRGHGLIFIDFPAVPAGVVLNLEQRAAQNIRPYWRWIDGRDILSWRVTKIGGVEKITMVSWRECSEEEDGSFGIREVEKIRIIKQEVIDGAPAGSVIKQMRLGAITWELYVAPKSVDGVARGAPEIESSGSIRGPLEIPIAPMYGGRKIGTLHSRPALFDLALSVIEELQVRSDYATVMHKTNVPTPVFKGRPLKSRGKPVVMGGAVDLPPDANADAFFLEPTGAAIGATRQRLVDIQDRQNRSGASNVEKSRPITAREAGIVARRRNARLVVGARSLQDALELCLQFHAAYVDEKDAGSIVFTVDLSDAGIDVDFARLCWEMYQANVLPLDAVVAVLKTGRLPDEFKAEEAMIRALAIEEAFQSTSGPSGDGSGDGSLPGELGGAQNANGSGNTAGTGTARRPGGRASATPSPD